MARKLIPCLLVTSMLITTGCASLQSAAESSCIAPWEYERTIGWYERERLKMWSETKSLKKDKDALRILLDIFIEREQAR